MSTAKKIPTNAGVALRQRFAALPHAHGSLPVSSLQPCKFSSVSGMLSSTAMSPGGAGWRRRSVIA